jgi:hypothetical protein
MLVRDASITLASLLHLLCREIGLSSKYPYRVMMMGTPLWLVLDGNVEEIGGFYTTRWLMASSSEEATIRAMRMDLQPIARNPAGSPVQIQIEECSKIDGFVTRRGGGFSFWPKEGGSDWGFD